MILTVSTIWLPTLKMEPSFFHNRTKLKHLMDEDVVRNYSCVHPPLQTVHKAGQPGRAPSVHYLE